MKPILALAATALLAGTPWMAQAEVPYACSGTSEEERAQAEAKPHSLRLVYAQPGGSYLGDVTTRIAGADGELLVEATCEGPWLQLDLPGGTYEVTATYRGEEKTQSVTVEEGASREQVITF